MLRFTKLSIIFATLFFSIGSGIAYAESPWLERSGAGRDSDDSRAGAHSIGASASPNPSRGSMPAAPDGLPPDSFYEKNQYNIDHNIVDTSFDSSYGVAEEGPPPADPSIDGMSSNDSGGVDHSGN